MAKQHKSKAIARKLFNTDPVAFDLHVLRQRRKKGKLNKAGERMLAKFDKNLDRPEQKKHLKEHGYYNPSAEQ